MEVAVVKVATTTSVATTSVVLEVFVYMSVPSQCRVVFVSVVFVSVVSTYVVPFSSGTALQQCCSAPARGGE